MITQECQECKQKNFYRSEQIGATLKIGLYTKKERWITVPLGEIPSLIAHHIDEPTGIYLSQAFPTQTEQERLYRFQPLWDFDDKENPQQALDDARRFVEHLVERGIPTEDLIPFTSGRKGIHIASKSLLGHPPNAFGGGKDWYELFDQVASEEWQKEFPTLDGGIYKNRAMPRVPWSLHASVKARKKPLDWYTFFEKDWLEIVQIARLPLNDMQWVEIESLLREALPVESPPPEHWNRFWNDLTLSFRHSELTEAAKRAAKGGVKSPRTLADWAGVLDGAGIEYREQGREAKGKVLSLLYCPCCEVKQKAYITCSGILRCFRTSCEAHSGLPASEWAKKLGIEILFEDAESWNNPTESHPERNKEALKAKEAHEALSLKMECLHTLPPGRVLLVKSTPGSGKTTLALQKVEAFEGKVIVAAATKERARELYEQYVGRAPCEPVALLQGRGENNCEDIERVRLVGEKGYPPGKVLCPGCPLFPANAKKEGKPSCLYYQQFETEARVVFCTYEQALFLHNAGRLEADLLIFDEDPSRAFMQRLELDSLQFVYQNPNLPFPVRRFGEFWVYTLAMAQVDAEGQPALYQSRLLVDWLRFCASSKRIDLETLLDQVINCVENVYDKPARLASLSFEELAHLPPAYLFDLAKALREELSHPPSRNALRAEEEWNSPLSIVVKRGIARLSFFRKVALSRQTPVCILDAYGREAYFEALLKRPVETLSVQAEIHAKVIQIPLSTSKRAFKKRREALYRRLNEVMSQYGDQKVLVYTHLAEVSHVQKQYPQVAVQHFWSGRGKDAFKDVDVILLFGTAEPHPQDLLLECRALYSADPMPISPLPAETNHRHRADERLEELLQMRREEEMEQAAHRLRPVWAEGAPKTIVVISQLPLPGLPADVEIDPRALQSQKRKDLFAEFIEDCLDEMGFYFDALAELAGVVEFKAQIADELRQRLASTGSLMGYSLKDPVQANNGGGCLYPQNRNAFYRDRESILEAASVPWEHLTLENPNGQATIKVWGNVEAAQNWLCTLASDRVEPPSPFDLAPLQAVCEEYTINFRVLFFAPRREAAYCPLFVPLPNRATRRRERGANSRRGEKVPVVLRE